MSIRNPFARKRDPHTGLAYEAGAPDPGPEARVAEDRRAARERVADYRRGRADQRAVDDRRVAQQHRRRGGSGVGFVSMLLLIAAAIGVTWMVLAYQAGSFAGGGAVVDRKMAEITSPARQAALDAVDRTGQAVQSAGQAVEAQGSRLRQTSSDAR